MNVLRYALERDKDDFAAPQSELPPDAMLIAICLGISW